MDVSPNFMRCNMVFCEPGCFNDNNNDDNTNDNANIANNQKNIATAANTCLYIYI